VIPLPVVEIKPCIEPDFYLAGDPVCHHAPRPVRHKPSVAVMKPPCAIVCAGERP
jgi:hypothetical protein